MEEATNRETAMTTVADYDFPKGETFTLDRGRISRGCTYTFRVREGVVTNRTSRGSCTVDVIRIRKDGEVSLTGHGWRYFHFADLVLREGKE